MINGIGVVGWGVGGIEAEAAMLGQPMYFLTPDVVGFELSGRLREGCTATDLVLTITEQLRKEKVVGKFVEFYGEGVEALTLADRATIANMAPEYGATMGFFPVDQATLDYFEGTGRSAAEIDAFVAYFKAQGLYGVPMPGQIDYSQVVKLDLGAVTPSLAGPKRPQDRIELGKVKSTFVDLFGKPADENGFSKSAENLNLEKLGFPVTAYGCTTCIGNSGDLTPALNQVIQENDLVCAAVLSGNRNFEARIHPAIKANFLASPPLVVAYAIAGSVLRDLMTEPLVKGSGGREVWIGDVWPSSAEVQALMKLAMDPGSYIANYRKLTRPGDLWSDVPSAQGQVYDWPKSTYIAEPPFFRDFSMVPPAALGNIRGARALGVFGDTITTDHISPAGAIKEGSPAGQYLVDHGVGKADFNSCGSRRGNHEVMIRGTFANVRIKNLMIPPREDGTRVEGGMTLFQPSGKQMFIYDAAMNYIAQGTPTVVFGGEEYGTRSSRDWAAKGTQLLGVKAVVARSFERIHRSNLVGMGVLPLQFKGGDSWQSLGLTGAEVIDVLPDAALTPQSDATLVIHREDGTRQQVVVTLRIDTPIEVDYYRAGGILPFVLRQLLAGS